MDADLKWRLREMQRSHDLRKTELFPQIISGGTAMNLNHNFLNQQKSCFCFKVSPSRQNAKTYFPVPLVIHRISATKLI